MSKGYTSIAAEPPYSIAAHGKRDYQSPKKAYEKAMQAYKKLTEAEEKKECKGCRGPSMTDLCIQCMINKSAFSPSYN